LLRIISVDFDVIDQLLIRYSAFARCWKKWVYNGAARLLFRYREGLLLRREVLSSTLIEFGISS